MNYSQYGFWIVLFAFAFIYSGCSPSQSSNDNTGSDAANSPGKQGEMVAMLDEDIYGGPPAAMEKAPRLSKLILGPGDEVEVFVYRHDELNRTLKIDASGKVMYPMAGDIDAAGLSIFELRDKIVKGLSKYIVEPDVTINVTSFQSQKVIVLGEVNSPGFFYAETQPSVLEIVAQAGGFTQDSKIENILLIRGDITDPQLQQLDLEKAIALGDLHDNVYLQGGDILYVPRTKISDLDLFFSHLSSIIMPFIQTGSGYLIWKDVVEGNPSRVTVSP